MRLVTLLVLLVIPATQVAALDLVVDGRSDYTIVLATDAIPAEQFAAEELANHLEKMSGAKLPIVTDAEPLPRHAILLGRPRYLAKLTAKPNWRKLGQEEYLLQVKGDYLIITGGRPRGALYGVYSLLEDYLGCRWFAPDTTVIPKRQTIRISWQEVRGRPGFEYRDPWMYAGHIYSSWWRDHFVPEFVARTRNSGRQINQHVHPIKEKHGGFFKLPHFGHNFSGLVPAAKYAADHPEYFALVDGKRMAKEGDYDRCVTNPEVIRIAAATVREWILADPDAELFSLVQADSSVSCQCDRCVAAYKRYSTRPESPFDHVLAWGGLSGRNLFFANEVAKILEKEFPNKRIGIWAYQASRNPPRNIKAHPNVFVWFNPIESCQCHPIDRGPINRRSPLNPGFFGIVDDSEGKSFYQPGGMYEAAFLDFANGIRQWKLIAKDQPVYIFHPAGFVCEWPLDLLSIAGTVRAYRDLGVQGVLIDAMIDIQAGFGFCRYWLWAHFLRNPDFDAEWGLRQFLDAYYGDAAVHIDAFIRLAANPRMYLPLNDASANVWAGKDSLVRDQVVLGCTLGSRLLTRDAIEQGYELFDKALKATATDAKSHRHVQAARMTLQHTMLKLLPPDDPRLKTEAASLLSLAKELEMPSIDYTPIDKYKKNLIDKIGQW